MFKSFYIIRQLYQAVWNEIITLVRISKINLLTNCPTARNAFPSFVFPCFFPSLLSIFLCRSFFFSFFLSSSPLFTSFLYTFFFSSFLYLLPTFLSFFLSFFLLHPTFLLSFLSLPFFFLFLPLSSPKLSFFL